MTIRLARLENIFVYFFAFSLWIPALSIPVLELQAIHIAGFLLCCSILLRNRECDLIFVLRSILLLGSYYLVIYLIFPVSDNSINVLIYYFVFLSPCILSFSFIVLYKFDVFAKGMYLTGCFFSFVATFQFIVGVNALEKIRISNSFSVVDDIDRVALLFPEPSGLGHMSAVWISIVYYLYDTKQLSTKQMIIGLILFLGCFISTKSASSIALAVSVIGFLYLSKIKFNFKSCTLSLIIITLMLLLTYYSIGFLFEERGDSMFFSIYNRFSTIFAVLLYYVDGNYGAGLGNNSTIVPYVVDVQNYFDVNSFKIFEGINSLIFTRIYEEGIVFFVFSCSFLFNKRKVFILFSSQPARLVFISSLLIAIFLAGYRAYAYSWFYLSFILIVYFFPMKHIKVLNDSRA